MTNSSARIALIRQRRAFAATRADMGRLLFDLGAGTLAAGKAARARRRRQPDQRSQQSVTPKVTVNLQDYYTPSFYGPLNSDANSLLLRGLIPMNVGGLPQLLRFTLALFGQPLAGGLCGWPRRSHSVRPVRAAVQAGRCSRSGHCSTRRPRPIASPARPLAGGRGWRRGRAAIMGPRGRARHLSAFVRRQSRPRADQPA